MLRTEFEGEEFTHRLLWRIVKEQAEEAEVRTEGWFSPGLVAHVFGYHTVEAYLNYVGERIAPGEWKDERSYFKKEPYRGALGKLRKVMDLTAVPWKPEDRPLATILKLKDIRDLIAHGKPEKFSGEVFHPMETLAPYPVSGFHRVVESKDTLNVLLQDVEAFLDEIQKRARPLLKVRDVSFGESALRGPSSHCSLSTRLDP